MARKKRNIFPNYCYHVMVRGVGGRAIFHDDRDRSRFCLLLQYASETCQFSVHGFCFMENHVHLILQPHGDSLSDGMHRLTFRYAQHFNKKVGRQGYLFQGRYKAIIVQHGVYLRRLIRYIHRNPVRANQVNNPADYKWSSHQAYRGNTEFTWLRTDLVLPLFGANSSERLEAFQRYINLDDTEAKVELEEIRKATGVGAYGNHAFVQEFQQLFEADANTESWLGQTACSAAKETEVSMEKVVDAVKEVTEITLEEMQSRCKLAPLVDARAILVWLVLTLEVGSTAELSSLLRRESTSIARLKARTDRSQKLKKITSEVSEKLQAI